MARAKLGAESAAVAALSSQLADAAAAAQQQAVRYDTLAGSCVAPDAAQKLRGELDELRSALARERTARVLYQARAGAAAGTGAGLSAPSSPAMMAGGSRFQTAPPAVHRGEQAMAARAASNVAPAGW